VCIEPTDQMQDSLRYCKTKEPMRRGEREQEEASESKNF
jgi:hypothetical protein